MLKSTAHNTTTPLLRSHSHTFQARTDHTRLPGTGNLIATRQPTATTSLLSHMAIPPAPQACGCSTIAGCSWSWPPDDTLSVIRHTLQLLPPCVPRCVPPCVACNPLPARLLISMAGLQLHRPQACGCSPICWLHLDASSSRRAVSGSADPLALASLCTWLRASLCAPLCAALGCL